MYSLIAFISDSSEPMAGQAAPTRAAGPLPISAGFRATASTRVCRWRYRSVLGMVAQTTGGSRSAIRSRLSTHLRSGKSGTVSAGSANITSLQSDARLRQRAQRVPGRIHRHPVLEQGIRVRSGKTRTPSAYETTDKRQQTSCPRTDARLSLVPNRDIGIQVQGDLAGGTRPTPQGVNGVPDGTSSDDRARTPTNSKDLAGRVVIQNSRGRT